MRRLLRNIKFGMEQWKYRKGQIIFLALQIIVSYIMLCYMFHNYDSFCRLNHQIEYLLDGKEIYQWRDMNDTEWYSKLSGSEYNKSFQELFAILQKAENEMLVVNNRYCTSINEVDIDIVEATDDFFDKYRLKGTFTQEEISDIFSINYNTLQEEEEMIKPVVAGASFAKQYEVGDVISDDFGLKYRIVAFLQKGEVYSMPTQSKELLGMDEILVTPIYIDITDNEDIMEFLYSSLIITENGQLLSDVEDKNYELKLLDGYFVSYSDQLNVVKRDTQEAMLLFGSFGIMLFAFSIIGTMGMLVQLLQEYEYEYGVNMLCGADIYDIFTRLIFQISMIVLVGLCITVGIFGFGKPFWYILGLAIASIVFIYGYSWKKLKTSTILSSLRSRS